MAFDFGLLKPFLADKNITDIDSNDLTVYVTHNLKGRYKVLDLEKGYLENLLTRMCNYPQIDKEFNFENPIVDGTMDGFRIHAVHESIMSGYYSLSIRRNPIELVVKPSEYKDVFRLLELANKLKWSYLFCGERGSGKTQFMRTDISLLPSDKSVTILAENDEMHMQELLSDRPISQFIINDVVGYEEGAKHVLRNNSDYVVFQEVRGKEVDDLFKILSSSSRVFATIHAKSALLLPQRMIQLSAQKNDEHLLSLIHDYVQMAIMPTAEIVDGETKRYVQEIALFWVEAGKPQKQLIYECYGYNQEPRLYDLPQYFVKQIKHYGIDFNWK